MKSNTEPSRREIIRLGGYGLGALAVSSLCNSRFVEGAPSAAQIRTRAKSVIWLVMNGGQSHVDTWDYKPQLAKSNGRKLEGFDKEIGFFPEKVGALMQSPFSFKQHGECGKWVSDIFPSVAQHVDDMAFVPWQVKQSFACAVYVKYRSQPYGVSVCGLVGTLWTGQREQ